MSLMPRDRNPEWQIDIDVRDKIIKDLTDERDMLVQVSAKVCDECGWAMKFPDEPCRNCEVHVLRKENARLREALQEIDSITNAYMSFSPAQYYVAVRQVIGNALKEVG